jgi:hypothetical protein
VTYEIITPDRKKVFIRKLEMKRRKVAAVQRQCKSASKYMYKHTSAFGYGPKGTEN